jgi:pimeloyl-ACP methyl ester carboxylesterase
VQRTSGRTISTSCNGKRPLPSAARYFDVVNNFDIIDLLSKVKTQTLVMHVRDDQMVPLEAGRQLAAGIPGARFIALPGRNHLFLEHEPASARFFEEIGLFLGADPTRHRAAGLPRLT